MNMYEVIRSDDLDQLENGNISQNRKQKEMRQDSVG